MNSISHDEFLAPCCTIAKEAGALIMGYFARGFATSHKNDKSPVTDADIAANAHIVAALSRLAPGIPGPIISAMDASSRVLAAVSPARMIAPSLEV